MDTPMTLTQHDSAEVTGEAAALRAALLSAPPSVADLIRQAYAVGYANGTADARGPEVGQQPGVAGVVARTAAPNPVSVAVTVRDEITVDGVRMHRIRDGVYGHYPTKMIVLANRDLTDAEADRLFHLVAYAFQAHLRADSMRLIRKAGRDGGTRALILDAPTRTSHRSHPMLALEEFETDLATVIAEGSPLRKTDRSGPRGTRAVEGLGQSAPAVTLYYDRVCG